MQRLKIPTVFKSGFETIASLEQSSILDFITELNKIPVGASTETTIELLATPVNKYETIIQTLDSLLKLISSYDKSLDNLVHDLILAYKELKSESEIQEGEIERLRSNLLYLLTKSENSKITFKAKNLLSEYENLYLDSRILTDVRMIFDDDLDKTNQYAVISHQLKIEYQKLDNVKEFFISLDENDLKILKTNIERALEKSKIITEQTFNNLAFISFDKTL